MSGFRAGRPIAAALLLALLSAAPARAEYLLHAGDSLNVSILGHEGLARQVTIDMDGQVHLPLLGEVAAGGRPLAEVRAEIISGYSGAIYRASEVARGDVTRTIDSGAVSVEIAEYRPVHVFGDVENPGTLAFRPGISVLQAIASVGGLGQTVEQEGGNEVALMRLQAQAETLKKQIELDRGEIARMRADVRNLLVRSAPDTGEDAAATDDSDVTDSWAYARRRSRELRDEQTEATVRRLTTRLEILQAQEEGAMKAVELDADRVKSLEETAQLRHVDEQTLLQARQGLVLSTSRALEISAERGDIEVELSRLSLSDGIADQVEIARSLGEIERREGEVQIALVELRGVSMQIEQLGITAPDLIAEPRYVVFRDGARGWAQFDADPQTKLEPGDVIRVRLDYREITE